MSKIYIAVSFQIEPQVPGTDILLASLQDTFFESFEDTETGITGYIQKDLWDEHIIENLYINQLSDFKVTYTLNEIVPVNWNEEWEKNFSPIKVNSDCLIRAPFHPSEQVTYEIVIEPKMSFGTGHHETTYLMIEHILATDFTSKTVLDMGCGTSILAILAEMKGAAYLEAIDIDDWCCENSEENITRNGCSKIKVYKGDVNLLNDKQFDTIIANINRNVLLNDIPTYSACLPKGGLLFLSGFYSEDVPVIDECCTTNGLLLVDQKTKNNWMALKYIKA